MNTFLRTTEFDHWIKRLRDPIGLVYKHSICTFTPTFGMDRIDGEFAQDVEEFVLNEVLDFQSHRMELFQIASEIPVGLYLRARGIMN